MESMAARDFPVKLQILQKVVVLHFPIQGSSGDMTRTLEVLLRAFYTELRQSTVNGTSMKK